MKKSISFLLVLILAIPCSFLQSFNKNNVEEHTGDVMVANVPASEGYYLGSPSMLELPNGHIIASLNWFGTKVDFPAGGITEVYKSVDNGQSWQKTAQLKGIIQAKLFQHNGHIYIIGPQSRNGKLVIRKTDYKAEKWTKSSMLGHNTSYWGGQFNGWLEGNAMVTPKCDIVNILRVDYRADDGMGGAVNSHDTNLITFHRFENFRDLLNPIDFSNIPGLVLTHTPKSSGLYIGSPSICILPDGSYVASHDLFGPGTSNNRSSVTKIYKSRNKGVSWEEVAVLSNQFWSNLFFHNDNLYLLGTTSGTNGNVSLRRSADGGLSWTEAIDATTGLLTTGAPYHCAPMPVIEHNGRLWRAMEDCLGPDQTWGKMFRARVMSAPVNADLMRADSWEFSNALPYDPTYLNGEFGGWLEGNVVLTPSGELVNILRVDYRVGDTEKAAIVNISEDGKTVSFNPSTGFIDFPGGCKKFTIRHDEKTNLYWTISNYIPDEFKGGNVERTRNTQALAYSSDLMNWKVSKIVLQHPDVSKHGFQYLDWQFEDDDIIAVSRTAFDDGVGGADNQHNANFFTFHRFENFRSGIDN